MNKILTAIKEDFHKEDFFKLFFLMMTNFLIMLSYSLVRPTSQAIFLEHVKAKNTPVVWLLSIAVLVFTIFLFDKLHHKLSVHRKYSIFAILMALGIAFNSMFIKVSPVILSYLLVVIKEVYVVVLFNLFLGYANNIFSLTTKKTIYGALGALGSLGATIGGIAVGYFINEVGVKGAIWFSVGAIGLSALTFSLSAGLTEREGAHKNEKKVSPFKAIADVKEYVFFIALVIILTQFVINIADFKLRTFVGEVLSSEARASLFGKVYSTINMIALASQLFFMPLVLNLFKNKHVQLSLPLIHLVSIFATFTMGSSVMIAAGSFVLFKAFDYSFFSTSKEILYHKLNSVQQYGAKYISDMVCYRFGKAAIAAFLLMVNDIQILNILIVIFLITWLISVVKLFKIQSKMEA